MIIIDATDLIAGRIAAYAAKKALLGEEVVIVNSEKAVITGHKKRVLVDYKRKRSMGTWSTGPFYHRQPDRLLRRIIRGMLPHKQEKGSKAFSHIMCYLGIPPEFREQTKETVEKAHISKLPNKKYIALKELSGLLGAKRTGE